MGRIWKKPQPKFVKGKTPSRERVEVLEQLCRDCYYCLENAVRPDCMAADLHIKERMEQLGLIEWSE